MLYSLLYKILGVSPANLFKSTKVLKATPQGSDWDSDCSVDSVSWQSRTDDVVMAAAAAQQPPLLPAKAARGQGRAVE